MAAQGNSDPQQMSAGEFNDRVKAWADTVRSRSLGTLVAETQVYSGDLRGRLKAAVNKAHDDGLAHAVAFKFVRYGVFVAYGVGNGYIRFNGRVVRGSHNPNRHVPPGPIRRRPVDWLDKNVEQQMQGLADIAAEYYGDRAAKDVLEQIDRVTIVKNSIKKAGSFNVMLSAFFYLFLLIGCCQYKAFKFLSFSSVFPVKTQWLYLSSTRSFLRICSMR